MSEDRAKEIIAEKVAKEVVESIGEDLAGALVEYANLVKDLAADLTDEQLEDSSYISPYIFMERKAYRSIYLHNSDSRGRVRRCCNMVSESGTA